MAPSKRRVHNKMLFLLPPPRRRLCDQYLLSVSHSVSLSYVLDYCEGHEPISLKLGPTSRKNWLTLGCDPIPDHFSTSLTIAELRILGDLLAFLIVTGRFLRHSAKWRVPWLIIPVLCRWNALETVSVALGLRRQRRHYCSMHGTSAVRVHSSSGNVSAWVARQISAA